MRNLLLLVSIFLTIPLYGQPKTIKTDIFTVMYSEEYEQPLMVTYMVLCPNGDASRNGLDFRKYDGVHTSDNDDYKNNPYDKGHMAPAADFNCDREMVRSTFSYLNCALQHEGLNRGPWKELERFERDLAKVYAFVSVKIICHFDDTPQLITKGGAYIPSGFTKIILCDGEKFEFYFPNKDVAGIDWSNFKTN
jgi:endonuclease G